MQIEAFPSVSLFFRLLNLGRPNFPKPRMEPQPRNLPGVDLAVDGAE